MSEIVRIEEVSDILADLVTRQRKYTPAVIILKEKVEFAKLLPAKEFSIDDISGLSGITEQDRPKLEVFRSHSHA